MHLGSQFPDIKTIQIEDINLDKNNKCIDTLSIKVDLDYSGNFLLSVDGKMKFGKTAYLSIKGNAVGSLCVNFYVYNIVL